MLLSLSLVALAGSLNPWGSATGKDTALFDPYLYVYSDAVNPILYGSVGLSDSVDTYVGIGEYIPRDGAASASLEVFPRFFLNPSIALSPHLYWTPGADSFVLAPEVHVNHTWTRFAVVVNAGWRPVIGSEGFDAGSVAAIIAPELRLAERFSAFVEVDPTVTLDGGDVALTLVPGFSATLDPAAHHAIAIGMQVPVAPDLQPASLGMYYCYTFSTKTGS